MDIVKPWMKTVASGRSYVFQQDGSYESFDSKLALRQRRFWSKEFWPLNSPDLNPYVWSVIERTTNKSRPNMTSLRAAIKAAFVGMDSVTLQRACKCFRLRIKAIIQANGRYIEYISNNYFFLQGSSKCHVKVFWNI